MSPLRVVRLYVAVLGAGLLLDGALRLALNVAAVSNNLLHAVSGIAMLGVAALAGDEHALRTVWAALVAGAFYVAIGVLGLTIDQPFGLQLGPGENALHFAVGLLALVLGAWALKTPAPSHTAARPAELGSVPATHRRARRRRGKARGQSRRR